MKRNSAEMEGGKEGGEEEEEEEGGAEEWERRRELEKAWELAWLDRSLRPSRGRHMLRSGLCLPRPPVRACSLLFLRWHSPSSLSSTPSAAVRAPTKPTVSQHSQRDHLGTPTGTQLFLPAPSPASARFPAVPFEPCSSDVLPGALEAYPYSIHPCPTVSPALLARISDYDHSLECRGPEGKQKNRSPHDVEESIVILVQRTAAQALWP